MSVMMESFYNMGDERHRRRLRRFIDAEDCMRKGIMDDRDVERATQEISNDIKEGQWKIRDYNRSVAGRKNKNHASVKAIHDLKK